MIGVDGEVLGILGIQEALRAAKEAELDLVELSPHTDPPVCKILDFKRFKYESKKRVQESKKKQKITHVKEIKLRPNIGQHDLDVKMRNMRKFLLAGDKVKVYLIFRGRELSYKDASASLLQKIVDDMKDVSQAEIEPTFQGNRMVAGLAPKRSN